MWTTYRGSCCLASIFHAVTCKSKISCAHQSYSRFYSPFFTFSVITLALRLRLQGPLSASGTGRLDVFHNGEWGTICHDYWSLNDAMVACRQLGYDYAVRALRGWEVPDGCGPIWLDDVGCTGNEDNLASCYHRGWGIHNCNHYRDAGVRCSFGKFFVFCLL